MDSYKPAASPYITTATTDGGK